MFTSLMSSDRTHNLSKKNESKRILVVEDDLSMTVILGRIILDIYSDAEIDWAISLEQACEKLVGKVDLSQKKPYHLVIADIFLEGNGTGLDLYKTISTLYPQIPFLVISSLPTDYVIQFLSAEDIKNLTYLKKPFLFFNCKEEIKNILNHSA